MAFMALLLKAESTIVGFLGLTPDNFAVDASEIWLSWLKDPSMCKFGLGWEFLEEFTKVVHA